jgi:hypothetical protein
MVKPYSKLNEVERRIYNVAYQRGYTKGHKDAIGARKLKCFKFTYNGVYLGGTSIVFANTKNAAIKVFKNSTKKLLEFDVSELEIKKGCVEIDNGDY